MVSSCEGVNSRASDDEHRILGNPSRKPVLSRLGVVETMLRHQSVRRVANSTAASLLHIGMVRIAEYGESFRERIVLS
jgi:hypothetical protein